MQSVPAKVNPNQGNKKKSKKKGVVHTCELVKPQGKVGEPKSFKPKVAQETKKNIQQPKQSQQSKVVAIQPQKKENVVANNPNNKPNQKLKKRERKKAYRIKKIETLRSELIKLSGNKILSGTPPSALIALRNLLRGFIPSSGIDKDRLESESKFSASKNDLQAIIRPFLNSDKPVVKEWVKYIESLIPEMKDGPLHPKAFQNKYFMNRYTSSVNVADAIKEEDEEFINVKLLTKLLKKKVV